MVECRSALVAVSLGDRRYGKRMALIRFCLPEKGRKKMLSIFEQKKNRDKVLD